MSLRLLTFLALALIACDREPPRSVVIVTIDTLRNDHTGPGDYELPTTPVLDRLSSIGRTYRFAFSASPSTVPSHAAILTGRYPSWLTVGPFNRYYQLHENSVTLAELAREAGLRTGAVVSNPALSADVGLNQGFEQYDDELEARELVRGSPERRADRALQLAISWLEEVRGKPFLLWLHLQDPHGPYVPHEGFSCQLPPAGSGARVLPPGVDHSGHESIPIYQVYGDERAVSDYRRRYDCEIAFADEQLDRLLSLLTTDPIYGNTLCIVTADHGEAMGEDGFFFSHGHSVGLDQVRVPLILAGPGITPGELRDAPVSNISVFSTALEFLAIEPPRPPDAPTLLAAEYAAPAIFVESVNQAGIVIDNIYLRTDRWPPDRADIWERANPNSGGFWKPLGTEIVRPLNGALSVPPEAVKSAEIRLREHVRQADAAQRALREHRSEVDRTRGQLDALRNLGYIN